MAGNIRNSALTGTLLSALIVGVSYGFVVFDETDEFDPMPTYSRELKPPPFRIQPTVSTVRYFKDLETIEARLKEDILLAQKQN